LTAHFGHSSENLTRIRSYSQINKQRHLPNLRSQNTLYGPKLTEQN